MVLEEYIYKNKKYYLIQKKGETSLKLNDSHGYLRDNLSILNGMYMKLYRFCFTENKFAVDQNIFHIQIKYSIFTNMVLTKLNEWVIIAKVTLEMLFFKTKKKKRNHIFRK